MGCLKSIINKIIFIILTVAFFTLGGWTFVKNSYDKYKNPPREEFIKTEKNYADFSNVSSDYQLSRCFNVFGYKKISAKYLPTNQKITIYDLKNEDKIKTGDFYDKTIDKKITDILNTFKDSFITLENFSIIEKNSYTIKGKTIPYVKFNAKVKNVPFKNLTGVIAAYATINDKTKKPSTKLIVTIADTKAFNPAILSGFVKALKFN